MRTIVIGDIHGCLDEFKELIAKLNLTPDDKVVCLGDFLDKGPDPVGCLRWARQQGFASILGNHEERHWKWRRNVAREASDPGYQNAMRPFHSEDELRQNGELSQEDLDWIEGLPHYLEIAPGFVAVHGGLLPGYATLAQQPKDKILRARWVDPATGKPVPTDYDAASPVPPGTVHWTAAYTGPYNVIYGHEAHSLTAPKIDSAPHSRCYGIDTGCVHGGRLTALVLDEHLHVSFVQVQARQMYAKPQWPFPPA